MADKWTVETDGTVKGTRILKDGKVVDNITHVTLRIGMIPDNPIRLYSSLDLRERCPGEPIRFQKRIINLATKKEELYRELTDEEVRDGT